MLAAHDRETFDRLLNYCELSKSGRRLLMAMGEEVKQSPSEFPWQDTILQQHY
jgi:hypothetical protein